MGVMSDSKDNSELPADLVADIVDSFHELDSMQHLDAQFLPSRAKSIALLELIRRLMFPGFFDEGRLDNVDVRGYVEALLTRVRGLLFEQARQAIRYYDRVISKDGSECIGCDEQAWAVTDQFLGQIPHLRKLLYTDILAAFDGDPAALNTDETIFCYPGVDAIFTHRIAHALYDLELPMIPRILSEYAHNETSIDIHPGARIGESFFIDHGTGVVIGETCIIGKNVKIYQGVSLGAISTKGGQRLRGKQRHPIIEDDVTIYAGAVILGGQTVIGHGATVGGSVFITESIPPFHTVTMELPQLKLVARPRAIREHGEACLDFEI